MSGSSSAAVDGSLITVVLEAPSVEGERPTFRWRLSGPSGVLVDTGLALSERGAWASARLSAEANR